MRASAMRVWACWWVRTCWRAIAFTTLVATAATVPVSPLWSQEGPSSGPEERPPATGAQPCPFLEPTGLPVSAYPLELLGLLAHPAQRRPITLTPSIALSEEYDNICLNNDNREWDLTTGVSPAVTLAIGGYTLTGAVYGPPRTGASSSAQADVDQNRIRFGLQFGYPLNFD